MIVPLLLGSAVRGAAVDAAGAVAVSPGDLYPAAGDAVPVEDFCLLFAPALLVLLEGPPHGACWGFFLFQTKRVG
ncbi:hypothetical protein F5Y15DRAFT_373719 [Xylariaceae sp. FL0016]|nr:hypothetical protein F5Y15DRAFT_373719 [Xylariaceae sp. FL0016]